MSLAVKSKREHCIKCNSSNMQNHVLMRPGEDLAVFVACADCGEFVARYTLKLYTCEDPYRSFLRQMRHRRMASGPAAARASKAFSEDLWADFELAKKLSAEQEETEHLEELIDDWDGPRGS